MDIVTYGLLKKNKLTQSNSYGDFPETGVSGALYLAKDTGQTYYWDETTQTYITIGTAGRTGIYSTSILLPTTFGQIVNINKSDLTELVAPTVSYSEGSEVVSSNAAHAVITANATNEVTVRIIADNVIDSFEQVETRMDVPAQGQVNVLYAIKDEKECVA